MQQAPRWAGTGQPDREPGGVGHGRASLARKTLDLRRKPETHISPDGINHALRLFQLDRARIARSDELLLPCIHPVTLAVPVVHHDSNNRAVSPTGRFRLTR